MAKRKTKIKTAKKRARKVKTVPWEGNTAGSATTVTGVTYPLLPPEVVLVPVPIEKTKDTMWQQFVAWIRG